MARVTRRIQPITIWVPPQYTSNYSFTVTRNDSSVDDLTLLADKIEIEDGVTELIGRFSFEMWDPNETYKDAYTGMETVRYYSDYAATATTLRFRGRIEKIVHRNNKLYCSGRSESLYFLNKTVTQSYEDMDCSDILKSLNTIYGGGLFTVTNVAASSGTTLTVNWTQKPFWECVAELCRAAGYDCYVDCSLDWHFFEVGSVENNGEGIVYNYNLVETGEFGDDISTVKNKIIVYGAEKEGIQTIYTAEDTTSQDNYQVREEVINDDNITSYQQAKEFGDYWLNEKKNPLIVGEVIGVLLSSIQPGEKIWIGDPINNLNQGKYNIQSYKHSIDLSRGLYTTVKVEKEPRKITHVVKSMVQRDNEKIKASLNPFEMSHSYNDWFETDTGSHNNTEITDGVLKLQAGQSSGNWTSLAEDTVSDVSEAYILAVGETLTGASFEVSADNGLSYDSVSNKSKVNISNSGKQLVVRVTLSDADTQIESLGVMYK